jgi:hypothetical protein
MFKHLMHLSIKLNASCQAECVLKIDVMMGGYSKHNGMYV